MYSNIGSGPKRLAYASTILGCLALLVTIPIYIFYWYGSIIRAKSPFAQEIIAEKAKHQVQRNASVSGSATAEA